MMPSAVCLAEKLHSLAQCDVCQTQLSVNSLPRAIRASQVEMQLLRSNCYTSLPRSARRLRVLVRQLGNMPTAPAATSLQVERIPCLSDNYVWLVHDVASKHTAVVDPAEVEPVEAALKAKGWQLNYIWNTHHHMDHVGGNLQLKQLHPGLQIIGPRADKSRIPGIDVEVGEGDVFEFGSTRVQVFDTPGHTRGHITYWAPSADALFPGDTLFALGCGRLFEGTPEQMWTSLSKLLPLPDTTRVYCAHEYTQSNARFAVTVDPDNQALQQRKADIDKMRSQGQPTVPSLLGEEKATNPFLRPFDQALRSQLGLGPEVPDWQVFGAVRRAKDEFRG